MGSFLTCFCIELGNDKIEGRPSNRVENINEDTDDELDYIFNNYVVNNPSYYRYTSD